MDLYTAVRLYTKERKTHSLYVAPDIPAKKINGARQYASFGEGEHPIALLDDTTFGSATDGAVLTSEALYFSKPKQRIPLALIRSPSVFPQGLGSPGYLETSEGTFTIPKMALEEMTEALRMLMDAVSRANGGAVERSPPIPPIEGPLRDLAMRSLYHERIEVIPEIADERIDAALTNCGVHLDFMGDEQILAFVDETSSRDATEGAVLTDRRICWKILSESGEIPYGAIVAAAPRSTALGNALYLGWGQNTELKFVSASSAVESLARFFNDMIMRVPPHERWAPVAPIEPSEGDPLGAVAAIERLNPGPRTLTVLHVLRGLAAQIPQAMGVNMVKRATLLHHTLNTGRGMHQGWYTSPLSVNDFVFAFNAVVGAPFNHQWAGPVLMLDYSVQGSRNIGGSVASTAAGLAALAVFGVGWYSVPRVSFRGLRLSVQDMNTASGFSMQGLVGDTFFPLEQVGPDVVSMVFGSLPRAEAQVLLLRALYGPNASPDQLYAEGPHGIYHRLSQLLPYPPDLALFQLQGR